MTGPGVPRPDVSEPMPADPADQGEPPPDAGLDPAASDGASGPDRQDGLDLSGGHEASAKLETGPARDGGDAPDGAGKPDEATDAGPEGDAAPQTDQAAEPAAAAGSADAAASGDGQAASKRRRARKRPFWRELPVLIVIALIVALLIKNFVVQAFFIPTSSMEPTIDEGDKVLVNKLVYDFRPIEPGDIVVFNGAGSWDGVRPSQPSSNPFVRLWDATAVRLYHSIAGLFGSSAEEGEDYIKRVIGVPGDVVACCNAAGDITVNGVALHEQSYLYPGNKPSLTRFHVKVAPGQLWVMGDHRAVSDDSRYQGGPHDGEVPESAVIGRAFVIVWPPSRWRILPIPSTFSQPGISSPQTAASATGSAGAALNRELDLGIRALPESSPLPLAAGFAVALPLTWLQRRLRRWLRRRSDTIDS